MPDQVQIQEFPERHQKLHGLVVDRVLKALETEKEPNASTLRTCLDVLKASDVDVKFREEKIHQPGNSLAPIRFPFDAQGGRMN